MQHLPPLTVIRGVKGAFYVMAKYRFSDASSQEVAIRLLEEAKVITIRGGSFGEGGDGHLRISFGGELNVINEAFDRIEQWLGNRGYPVPSAQ